MKIEEHYSQLLDIRAPNEARYIQQLGIAKEGPDAYRITGNNDRNGLQSRAAQLCPNNQTYAVFPIRWNGPCIRAIRSSSVW